MPLRNQVEPLHFRRFLLHGQLLRFVEVGYVMVLDEDDPIIKVPMVKDGNTRYERVVVWNKRIERSTNDS